jgi:hypothetical protein
MQAMKRRVTIAGAAVALGLLAPLAATAPPATAGTGVGCGGSNCSVDVWKFVHLTGHVNPRGNERTNPIDIPPPPCLWNSIGDATTGSNYILSEFGTVTQGDSLYGVYDSVQQAKKLRDNPQPGTWYELPINPAAGAEGAKECLKLPLFAFEPPGVAPPMPNVPGIDLAEYAYNHLIVPTPDVITNPEGKNWVNLATFVWTGQPDVTQYTATATLGDEHATVTATFDHTTVTASGPAKVFTHCGLLGSGKSQDDPPATGPGTPPDCGVLWRGPTTGGSITVDVTWNITWTATDGTANNPALPPIEQVHTKANIQVAEIQSING